MEIAIGPGVSHTLEEICASKPFIAWRGRLLASDKHTRLTVHHVGSWGGRIRTMYVEVDGGKFSEYFLMRSETVDVLTILTDGVRKFVAIVDQYRASMGRRVMSNPAGGVDDESPHAAARREVPEELDLDKIREELGLEDDIPVVVKRLLRAPNAASPGTIDELVHFYYATIEVTPELLDKLIDALHERETGMVEEGEEIVVLVISLDAALDYLGGQEFADGKAIQSLTTYLRIS